MSSLPCLIYQTQRIECSDDSLWWIIVFVSVANFPWAWNMIANLPTWLAMTTAQLHSRCFVLDEEVFRQEYLIWADWWIVSIRLRNTNESQQKHTVEKWGWWKHSHRFFSALHVATCVSYSGLDLFSDLAETKCCLSDCIILVLAMCFYYFRECTWIGNWNRLSFFFLLFSQKATDGREKEISHWDSVWTRKEKQSVYDSKETRTEKYYINGVSEHDVLTVLQKCAVWEIYTVVFTSLGTPGKITY